MSTASEISQALFGGVVDVEALVAKMDPGPSDVHTFGESNPAGTPPIRARRTGRRQLVAVRKGMDDTNQRRLGAGLSAVGAGAGALGLYTGVKAVRRAGWKATPRHVKALIPVEVAGLGGELLATKILHGDAKRVRQQPVAKGRFEDMVQGVMASSRLASAMHAPHLVGATKEFGAAAKPVAERKAFEHAGRVKATKPLVQSYGGPKKAQERLGALREGRATRLADRPVVTPGAKAKRTPVEAGIAAGQNARADLGRMANTTSGKVALGGAGALGAHHLFARRTQAAEDPYAYYGKRATDDVTFSGSFSKFDDDKRLAFGWANVSKVNGIPVVDRQGDYVSIEDIEEAAYTYVERSRIGGDMHKRVGGKSDGVGDRPHHVADLVESMVFDDAKCESLGLPDDFPRGWWVGFRVFDDDVWDMAKSGERAGFSIHGKGIRKSVAYDELMGVT